MLYQAVLRVEFIRDRPITNEEVATVAVAIRDSEELRDYDVIVSCVRGTESVPQEGDSE